MVLWQNANANLPGCHAYRKGENDRSLITSDNKTDRSTRHQLSDRVAANTRNSPDTALEFANTFAEPDTQGAVRLMPQPQPGELNHDRASLGVASLADPLIMAHRAALKMRRRQTDIARQLFTIVK